MPRLHATPITRSFPKTTVVFGLLAATSSLHLQAAPGAAEMVIHADTPQWTIGISTASLPSISGAVSTKVFGWMRIRPFPTRAVCAMTWWRR